MGKAQDQVWEYLEELAYLGAITVEQKNLIRGHVNMTLVAMRQSFPDEGDDKYYTVIDGYHRFEREQYEADVQKWVKRWLSE